MFESITLDKALGLESQTLARLGELVVLTGPNGAGKTRILKLLTEQIQGDEKEFQRLSVLTNPDGHSLGDVFNAVHLDIGGSEAFEESEEPEALMAATARRTRANNRGAIRRFITRYRLRDGDWRERFKSQRWPRVVHLFWDPESGYSSRRSDEPEKNLRAYPDNSLRRFANLLYLGQHPDWAQNPEHAEFLEQAREFKTTVEAMLDQPFGAEAEGTKIYPTLDGRRMLQGELSQGQRLLLRWAELIHGEAQDLRDAVVLIDEPELHLHPEALLRTLDRIRELGPAQLFLATHSVPLLAWAQPKNIYAVDQGRVRWAGNRIDQALGGLLGGEDGTERLRAFLSDAGTLAFHQFAAESLLPPGVVGAPANPQADPQTQGFVTRIGELLAEASQAPESDGESQDVHVLEYGAGKGRLVAALAATPPGPRARLRYYAYNDPTHGSPEERKADAHACARELARLRGRELGPLDDEGLREHGYRDDLREFVLEAGPRLHAVILCNVLHEIPPKEWPKLFAKLARTLRDDGRLLILEDQRMRIGELPHDCGYLVLDAIELAALFGLPHRHEHLRYHLSEDRRLSIAEVSASALTKCTQDGVTQALDKLRERALEGIKALRKGSDPDLPQHRRGRLHAYYALLYTNATLAQS